MAEGSLSRKRGRELSCEGDISSSRHDSGSSSDAYSGCATTHKVQEQIPATTVSSKAAAATTTVTGTAARESVGSNPNNNNGFLRKGMVVLKGFVSKQEQRELVVR